MLAHVLWRRRALLGHDGWSRQRLGAYQQHALAQLREFTYRRSPFYARFHRGLEGRPLQDLPVLTKAHMLEAFDELVTNPAIHLSDLIGHLETLREAERFLGKYYVTATSGSTGLRGVFLYDAPEWATVLAAFARSTRWAGLPVGLAHRIREASVASTLPSHMSARAAASVTSIWIPTLRLDASEPSELIVAELNRWRPDFLVAYASMAQALAEQQHAGRLHIAPKAVFTSSEVLTPAMRHGIERAWGPHLFEQYAASECGMIAAECDHHRGMHLLEDLVVVEVVDARNHPVPPGEFGDKVLLTVLFNRSQPLIRYELSDRVRLQAGTCPCGRPYRLLDAIEGRAEDVVYLAGPGDTRVPIHPNVFHRVLEGVLPSGWQVVQEAALLRVLVVDPSETFRAEDLRARLCQALVEHGALAPRIEIERVERIPRGAASKAPLIRALR